jgi:hypothetical protein
MTVATQFPTLFLQGAPQRTKQPSLSPIAEERQGCAGLSGISLHRAAEISNLPNLGATEFLLDFGQFR